MSSLLESDGAAGTEKPWDRQVSSRGARTTVRESCSCGKGLISFLVPGIWYQTRTCGIWYHVVPRGYHHHQYIIISLALRPSCSTILSRTYELWYYSSSKTLPAATTAVEHGEPLLCVCVLTLSPGRLGCRILTRHLFMVRRSYCGTAQHRYDLGTLDYLDQRLTAPDVVDTSSATCVCTCPVRQCRHP